MAPRKYAVIADDLRERCRGLPPGTRLPSEKDLADQYGVSRMTLRQAIDVLVEEKVVNRLVGRGSFTCRPVVSKGDLLTSFTEDMRQRGMAASTRLIGFERGRAAPEVAAELGMRADEDILIIERLRLADGEPMCLEVAQLPWRFHSALTPDLVERSLHEALRGTGVRLTSGTRVVRAVALGDREAMLLGLPRGEPVLEVVHVFHDAAGRAVQRARSLYRADRYEIVTEVHRSPADAEPAGTGPAEPGD